MFGVLYAAEGSSCDTLMEVAREFSPRIEVQGTLEVVLDLGGLERLFGDAQTIGAELRRTAADRGLRVRVAIAGTCAAARLVVRHRAGVTVVEPGREAAALASIPLSVLSALSPTEDRRPQTEDRKPQTADRRPETADRRPKTGDRRPETEDRRPETGDRRPKTEDRRPKTGSRIPDPGSRIPGPALFDTLRRWGVKTLGEFAALPSDEVAARLGRGGVAWQRLACGDDIIPLLPTVVEERFEQALDLEWPIEGLEPLSFVLGRLMEPLEAHLARRDRGAAVLHVRLHLVDRTLHARSLQLPAPMRDARTLRTLALLDLESHPPAAAIDRVVVTVDPTPGRVVQFSLLTRPQPSPEQLSTLMARLNALMGEGRCGSPVEADSWRPGAFEMRPFGPRDPGSPIPDPGSPIPDPAVALRRFRFPVPARVAVEGGKPVRVAADRRGLSGGRVAWCAGPWRTSGDWWRVGWDCDEWDVTLTDGATYRLFRERDADRWFIEGIVD
jgi:hypothetical protein